MLVAQKDKLNWGAIDWLLLAVFVSLGICLFLPQLGSMPILDPSDGYYSEAAREMLESGNYIVPYLNYQPWFEKPILNYWLIVASYKLFGVSEFAARIPSSFSAILLIAVSYVFGRQFLGRRAAAYATLILASSVLVLVVGRLSLTDMPLALLTSVSTFSFLVSLTKSKRLFNVIGYVALGLAVLCKGPVAIGVVAISLAAFIFATQRSIGKSVQQLRRLDPLVGVFIVALIAVPWYWQVYEKTNGQFFYEFFVRQNVERAMGSLSHKEGPLYYIPVVLLGFFPWSFFLIAAAPWLVSFAKRILHRGTTTNREELILFSLLSMVWMLVFFSLLGAKLFTYILPAFLPMAYLVGCFLDLLTRSSKVKRLATVLGLLVLTSVLTAALMPVFAKKFPAVMLLGLGGGLASALIFAFALFLLFKGNALKSAAAVLVGVTATIGVIVPWGLNLHYDMKCSEFHSIIWDMHKRGLVPAVYGRTTPSASFYLHVAVPQIEEVEDYIAYVRGTRNKDLWIIVARDRMKQLTKGSRPYQVIYKKGRWTLIVLPKETQEKARDLKKEKGNDIA